MSSDSPLLSLIIPAYNAESTLAATLQSIAGQDFDDYEVVVVDDASTDATAQVAASMVGYLGPRLRLISLSENSGSTVAYKTGLSQATGKYVGRCDADDIIPDGTFSAVAEVLRHSGAKMLWGGYFRGSKYISPPDSVDLNSFSIDVDHFSQCNKWISRDIAFAGFDGLNCWDDLAATARIFALKPACVMLDRSIYNYILQPHGQSQSTANQQRQLQEHIEVAKRLEDWFMQQQLSEEFEPFLSHLKFAAKVKLLRNKPRRLKEWKETFPEVNGKIMSLCNVKLRYRLLFAMANMLPERIGEKIMNMM